MAKIADFEGFWSEKRSRCPLCRFFSMDLESTGPISPHKVYYEILIIPKHWVPIVERRVITPETLIFGLFDLFIVIEIPRMYRVYLQTCHLLRHRLKVTIFETINIFGLLLWISSRNVARSLNFVVVKFEQSSICKTMIYPTTLKSVFGLVTRLQIDPVVE